jgi:hypothetical protein
MHPAHARKHSALARGTQSLPRFGPAALRLAGDGHTLGGLVDANEEVGVGGLAKHEQRDSSGERRNESAYVCTKYTKHTPDPVQRNSKAGSSFPGNQTAGVRI